MKVAIYTIALNEEQFVEKWYESAKEADYLLIADTGSTDFTVAKAEALGINVIKISINPWRFDDARNASLSVIPSDIDYCIALDMDEVILPGWRKELEQALADKVTRPRYKYTWSWNADGTPGLEYGGDKIHARNGYRWKHPVHEIIVSDRLEEAQGWCGIEIHHHPDSTKSRGQYLPLLKLSTVEDPTDDRNAFYYARELYFNRELEDAAKEFLRHLLLPKAIWAPERAASYRYLAKCDPENAKEYLLKAIEQDPNRREQRVELANHAYLTKDWNLCYTQCLEALAIKEKPFDYLCEDFAWKDLPHDLASISAWNLGKTQEAIDQVMLAIGHNPEDARLKKNLEFYNEQSKLLKKSIIGMFSDLL
jgi:glycosyltransferase involved in cell wall biosynthesis